VCSKRTPYAPAPPEEDHEHGGGGGGFGATRVEERCSHHARTVFVAARCSVCLDDPAGPPMVRVRRCRFQRARGPQKKLSDSGAFLAAPRLPASIGLLCSMIF
jgi:hypothetical protein